MTIQINFKAETFSEDLKILIQIINSGSEMVAETMSRWAKFQNISLTPFPTDNVVVNVTPEEFVLIGIFNKGF